MNTGEINTFLKKVELFGDLDDKECELLAENF